MEWDSRTLEHVATHAHAHCCQGPFPTIHTEECCCIHYLYSSGGRGLGGGRGLVVVVSDIVIHDYCIHAFVFTDVVLWECSRLVDRGVGHL